MHPGECGKKELVGMPKKKQKAEERPTIDEVRSLKYQLEEEVFNLASSFEDITGVYIRRIEISRERKIGFFEKDTMKIDITLDI